MTPYSVKTSSSSGASLQMTTASDPLITTVQRRDCTHQLLVRHHEPNPAPMRLDRPLRHPRPSIRVRPVTPESDIAALLLHKINEDVFQARLVSLELLHDEGVVGKEDSLDLSVGGFGV